MPVRPQVLSPRNGPAGVDWVDDLDGAQWFPVAVATPRHRERGKNSNKQLEVPFTYVAGVSFGVGPGCHMPPRGGYTLVGTSYPFQNGVC